MKFTPKRLTVVAVLFLAVLFAGGIYSAQKNRDAIRNRALRYYETLPAADLSGPDGLAPDFRITEEFRSNLPVLSIRWEGEPRIGSAVILKVFRESPFAAEQEEAVSMRVSHMENGGGKPEYTLVPSEGEKVSLLGMPEGTAFRLYGEASDPSLVRSYVGIRTATEVTGYAPRSAFCELLTEEPDGFRYEGVYRFAETVSAEENRLEIAHNRAGEAKDGYILRRGDEQGDALPVMTWAQETGKTLTPLWTFSPLAPESDAISYMQTHFSDLEKRICGESRDYRNVMDTGSFIDYFLINEYFGNRDAGKNAYYLVDWQGKLSIGPVETFEHAMNSPAQPESARELVLADSDLYRDLLRDGGFLRTMQGRYVELRQNVLKEDTVYRKINEATAYLDAARKRNAARWGRETRKLTGGESEEALDLYRMKTYLSEHGKSISEHLAESIEADRAANEGKGGSAVSFVLSLLLFLIPCILVNRRG